MPHTLRSIFGLLLTLGTVALLIAPTVAQQSYPTIVGRWYSPSQEGGSPEDCDNQWGWTIKPMALGNAMVQCQFTDVARDGWEVTWRGSCSMEGQDIDGNTIVATETNGSLKVVFGDGSWVGPLQRCTKK